MTAVTVPRPGEVQAIIDHSPPAVARRMAGIETRLTEVMGQAAGPLAVHVSSMLEAGGKRLRPLLVFLAAEAASGEVDEAALVRAAVSVELVHSATLVHDDVLDAADLRRGRPTVVAAAGRPMAVAAGDLLFSRAFAELARNDSDAQLRALSDASSALAEGELLQREDAYATAVTLRRYLHRCELKTARLFAAAARLGALAGAAPNGRPPHAALADALGAFAQGVGLAFQLLDDILDVSGPAARTGKRRGTDLLDGTVTLPLILAREHDAALAGIDLRTLGGPAGAEELCDRIAATGALVESRAHALRIIEEAKAQLPSGLSPATRRLFERVADVVVDRYS